MMKNKSIIVTLLAAVLLAGCATKKQVAVEKVRHTAPAVRTVTIQEKTIAAQPEFTSAMAQRVRFSINYEQRQLAANGTITFIKDSVLIVSVQPLLGIELLRMEATPEEVLVIDKMNRRYDRITYDQLEKQSGVPIRFRDVQALIMDRMFAVGETEMTLMDKEMAAESVDGVTTVTFKSGRLQYTYRIAEETLDVLSNTIQFVGKKERAEVQYEGHSLRGTVRFPERVVVTYAGGPLEASGSIALPYVTFDSRVNAARINLRNYQKVDFMSIISGK